MKSKSVFRTCGFVFAGMLALAAHADAQAKTQTASSPSVNAYSVARENVLQGTVVSYTDSSSVPPLGAHVKVQTSSGIVDVHIGNGKLLTANHVALDAGDAVKITGENVAYGQSTVYVARLIQKGSQTVTLRSLHGTPLSGTPHAGAASEGVR
jgi:hypothetical protein